MTVPEPCSAGGAPAACPAHLQELLDRYPVLRPCVPDLLQAFEMLVRSFASGGTLLVAGNGGSAADAEHMAGELLKGFVSQRPLPAACRDRLGPALANRLQGALPVIPLTGFLSLRTAYGNDCDPDSVFAQLLYALHRPGDVFLGISTSGEAANLLVAAEVARRVEVPVIGLTGSDGGRLAALAHVCIQVPEQATHKVQELHLPVYHTLSLMLEAHFFTGGEPA